MKYNKFWTALLSLAIALGLWFYVVTVVKPNTTNTYYNIPVALEGESRLTELGLMIVGGQDTMITMELHGNRMDLDKINSGNITLVADLTRIDGPGEVELSFNHRLPGDVPSGAVTVQSKSPDTIKLMVENRVSKPIEVKTIWTGVSPDPSMYIVEKDKAILSDPEITIVGPESVISKIDHATITVDLTGRTETFGENYPITLCDEDGNGVDAKMVAVSTPEVRMDLSIRYYREIRLEVEVIDGGGATRQTSSIRIDPQTIKVSGNQKVVSKLTNIPLGKIDLSTLTDADSRTFTISLDEGLTNESGVTEATVEISFPNLGTKELTITDIQVINVPEGMSYEMLAQELKVTVRGPKRLVNRVTASDLTVTIDLSEAAPGTATYKPVITVDSKKHPGIGAIGAYSVGITLQEDLSPASEE